MLSTPQRTITITPVVTRSLEEMQAITDRAFFEGSSARWWYWTEEHCFGLTERRLLWHYRCSAWYDFKHFEKRRRRQLRDRR